MVSFETAPSIYMVSQSDYNKKRQEALRAVLSAAYKNYGKGLASHAFFKVRNEDTGQDLVQDTFMKTWKYLVKGGKIESMKAFLYHVLNNLIIDEYRKRKTVSLDEMTEKGFELADEKPERLFNIFDGKAMVVLIQRLPEKYRKVMRMRFVQDLSLKEMSLITGQSKNSLAVQIHRGLKKLKALYEHRN